MDFQKYNIKEKKQKEKGRKKKITRIIKTTTTTIQRLYTAFALKNRFFFKVIVGYKNKN